MQRLSITIDDELLDAIDGLCERKGYSSRSEAFRDIVRDAVAREQQEVEADTPCFATLSYVYDHETRDLARRLTSAQHHRHDLSVTTLHLHVSERDCLEVVVLKGSIRDVRAFANSVTTQRGVRLANLYIIPTSDVGDAHSRSHDHHH
jgi:CopG family nickel-responsive transcriptional regulator